MKANEVARNAVKEKLVRNEVVASISIRLTRGIEIAPLVSTGTDIQFLLAAMTEKAKQVREMPV